MSRPLLATGISVTGLFWLLNLFFCLLHYGIASQTAHVTALVPPFLAIMLDAGEPPSPNILCKHHNSCLPNMYVLHYVYALYSDATLAAACNTFDECLQDSLGLQAAVVCAALLDRDMRAD